VILREKLSLFMRNFMEIRMRPVYLTLVLMALGGCSSVIEGTSQTLSFESNPPGAECALERNGVAIGNVKTPGGIVVQKTKHNIRVTCRKDGFEDATAHLKSEVAGATFGNIILGGGIGWAIDSASGADNKYQSITTVTLIPRQSAAATASGAPCSSGTQAAGQGGAAVC